MARKYTRRERIKMRIRKKITGTPDAPRISVFRSNAEIYAQIIDDEKGHTLVAASSREKELAAINATKTEKAALVGKILARRALEAGIKKVRFDRNGYLYHGRVKALAEAARQEGLEF
ncbi:MAG: 50S ribosomal protein L18 [Flavobacteriales bacterium]|nr:50S ribosomal protein L18 [Flavobacteriales bacterium]MCX7768029.1 50S ribosomal protein L18 [Flavobacteriales bacterium]MDW8409234.1 50S ribosomal protein L18 [Flavobacteriales bacterium]